MEEKTKNKKPSFEMWLVAVGYEMAVQKSNVQLYKFEPMFKELYETDLSPSRAVAFFAMQELIIKSGV